MTAPARAPLPTDDTEVQPDHQLEWIVAEEVGGLWAVVIHNDDATPMDFVVQILRFVFDLAMVRAQAVMLKAHYTGTARVVALPHEEAKYRVGQAHGLARAEGYPLTFTIEPD